MALIHDKVLQMRVSDEWLATIDDWRAAQRPMPSRAEAIRRLVEFALSAEPLAELMALAPPGEDFREWVKGMIAEAHQDNQPKRQSMAELDAELAAEAPRRIRRALNLDD